jgi:hypothetical protein
MTIYLLNSMLCLLALLLIHRLLLQRELLHRFNRFFLLAAVLGSFLIPLYTIEVPAEQVEPMIFEAVSMDESAGSGYESFLAVEDLEVEEAVVDHEQLQATQATSQFPWKQFLWAIYFAVSSVFLIRFLRNLGKLWYQIQVNPHVDYRGETLVMHPQKIVPFSFLKYIFVSQAVFEKEGISDAVFAHEQCHVREKHSWDVLLVEALLVPLWFHPGLHFARQAIQLNHEFIADQVALKTTSVKEYQQQLLDYISVLPSQSLASSLNFSLTKKRLEMMKKKKAGGSFRWLKIFAILPLVGALMNFCGQKVEVQPEEENKVETLSATSVETPVEEVEIDIKLLTEREVEVDGKVVYLELLPQLLEELREEDVVVRLIVNPRLKMGVAADLQKILVENEIRKVVYGEWPAPDPNPNREEDQAKYFEKVHFVIEGANMEYSHKTYEQLTDAEKSKLVWPIASPSKKIPHPLTFADWKRKEKHALWLDGQVMSNQKLSELVESDIAWFMTSGVRENAKTARFPQPFQTHLYTPEYYEQQFGENSHYQNPMRSDTITITQRFVFWNKDIERYPDRNTAFLQKNAHYEKLRTSGTIYSQKSDEERALLNKLYEELDREYSQAGKRQRSLKKPIPPSSEVPRNGDPQSDSSKTPVQLSATTLSKKINYSFANLPALHSNDLKEYLTVYSRYQLLVNETRFLAKPSLQEIEGLFKVYRSLDARYKSLSIPDRMTVKGPSFPFVKMKVDGKVVYRKIEELTAEERKGLGC